jgi:hypothetical protein
LQGRGVHPPFGYEFGHTAAPNGDERKLSGNEKTIGGDEQQHGEYSENIENTAIESRHASLPGGSAPRIIDRKQT